MSEQTVQVYPQYPYIYGYIIKWQLNWDKTEANPDEVS